MREEPRERTLIVNDVVLTRTEDSVRWITLNRPDRLNALTRRVLERLLAELEVAAADDTVRAVVLTGAGSGFSAGGDLRTGLHEVTGTGDHADQIRELRRFMRVSELLRAMDKPTIAAVNGACVGAGMALACAADIRIAAESAFFATAFLSAGVSGDFGGTWTLSSIVGQGVATDLYLTGRRLDAPQALMLGLITTVCPTFELPREVQTLAATLARRSPTAMRAIKGNFAALPCSLADLLDVEAAHHVQCTNSVEAASAMAAFTERAGSARAHA